MYRKSFFCIVLLLTILGPLFAQAPVLFPDVFLCNPAADQINVLREKGRIGIVYQFVIREAGEFITKTTGFDLNLASAQVTLEVPGSGSITCGATENPGPGAGGYFTIDTGNDSLDDAVMIYYNGNFPALSEIRVSVTGAQATAGGDVITQDAATDPVLRFTTADNVPREHMFSLELVFDISGSMGWNAVFENYDIPLKRMTVLKNAARVLYDENAKGGLLSSAGLLGDKIGAVYFTTTATVYDPTPGGSNLEPVHLNDQLDLIFTSLQSQLPTSATSIGDGLKHASTHGFALDTTANKKVVFLFSDGEQNTAPMVDASGAQLAIDGVPYPDNIKVYTITAGDNTTPGYRLQQDIATLTGGQYVHLQRDSTGGYIIDDLEDCFTQMIADLAMGDKLELAKSKSDIMPKATTKSESFWVNSKDLSLTIIMSSSYPENPGIRGDVIPYRLITPQGTPIDIFDKVKAAYGMSYLTLELPLIVEEEEVAQEGQWQLEMLGNSLKFDMRYHLMILTDNSAISSAFAFHGQDFNAGEAVPIRVELKENGQPLTGATVISQFIGPREGIGNILSTNSPSPGQSDPGGDTFRSEAQEKLYQLLNDPDYQDLFKSKELPTLILLDDGNTAHGDETAQDGIYSAVIYPQEEGHLFAIVTVMGTLSDGTTFERTNKLSFFARPKAVDELTEASLSWATDTGGNTLVQITLTPRDRHRNYIGPDYLGHLSITSSLGSEDSGLVDNLDGSYSIVFRLPSPESDPLITLDVMGDTIIQKNLTKLVKKLFLSAHAGYNIPFGNFAQTYKGSFSLGLDFEYRFLRLYWLGIETYLGLDHFLPSAGGSQYFIGHLSAHPKFHLKRRNPFRAAFYAGPGLYLANGPQLYFGLHGGVDLIYQINNSWGAELGYTYRNVDWGNIQYSTVKLGMRYGF